MGNNIGLISPYLLLAISFIHSRSVLQVASAHHSALGFYSPFMPDFVMSLMRLPVDNDLWEMLQHD